MRRTGMLLGVAGTMLVGGWRAVGQSAPPLSGECDCVLVGDGGFRIIDLRRVGFAGVTGLALNNVGQVLLAMTPDGDRRRGYVWEDGDITALASPPRPPLMGAFGYRQPEGRAINDDGVIVGFARYDGFPRAAVWANADAVPVVHYEADQDPTEELPLTSGYVDVAPDGAIAGEPFGGGRGARRAIGGARFAILPFEGVCATAHGVNSAGVVGGEMDDPDITGCAARATRWDADGVPTVLRGAPSRALAINDAGQILIRFGASRGVIDVDGVQTELFINPADLNESGVVGGQQTPGGATLWYEGERYPIGDRVVSGSDEWIAFASIDAINDRCWILGKGNTTDGGTSVPFLAIPTGCDTCTVDLDGDGELTLFDFLEFQSLFDAGDARADFDGDGSLTIFDFLAFQSEFAAGCP